MAGMAAERPFGEQKSVAFADQQEICEIELKEC
jgi:hypothetical protein